MHAQEQRKKCGVACTQIFQHFLSRKHLPQHAPGSRTPPKLLSAPPVAMPSAPQELKEPGQRRNKSISLMFPPKTRQLRKFFWVILFLTFWPGRCSCCADTSISSYEASPAAPEAQYAHNGRRPVVCTNRVDVYHGGVFAKHPGIVRDSAAGSLCETVNARIREIPCLTTAKMPSHIVSLVRLM